ncbi:histidine kinase dimerization/phospho-acceptor domain-containing protein [Bacillota bacterium LX-D]|nr:histidine kinase dimerization/phospho-acceptor domain-containing protein [Bacillota bacterium LX-D]
MSAIGSYLVTLTLPRLHIIGRDITERKKVGEELLRIERLNMMGAMAAGISHEIRNSMMTVLELLQLLSKKKCAPFQKHYSIIIEELSRTNSIITEFLYLARK